MPAVVMGDQRTAAARTPISSGRISSLKEVRKTLYQLWLCLHGITGLKSAQGVCVYETLWSAAIFPRHTQHSHVAERSCAGRRRRLGAGKANAGRDADPRSGAGAPVEEVAGGEEIPVSRRNCTDRRRHAQLCQPTTSVDAALAGHRRDNPRWTAAEGLASRGADEEAMPSEWEEQCSAPPCLSTGDA
jgi:hypothetical protein